MPLNTDLQWEIDGDTWVRRVGHVTFRYYPAKMEMEWRGKTYRGIAEKDINQFVENRRDR